jgi:hypothetical protein
MKEITIDSTSIKKYINILTDEECDRLYDYTFHKTNNPVIDLNQVPWEQKGKTNTLYYYTIDDEEIRSLIRKYKNALAEEMTKLEGVPIYPHLTTIVLWKPGQKMPRHVDDGGGYPEREQDLGMRYLTSVTYLNDNFTGGYTFVKNDGMNNRSWRQDPSLSFPNDVFPDYISVPEKGATITFYGSDLNAHGVTKLEEGDRIVLSTWFTKDPEYIERDDFYMSQEEHEANIQRSSAANQEQKAQQASQQSWNK